MKSFEDLKPGDSFTSESVLVTEEEILEFARRYDPQPIHTDAARAASGPFGGLIASGIQTSRDLDPAHDAVRRFQPR